MSTTIIEFACFASKIGKVDIGNACPVWRAQVQTESGKIVEAYIKHIPPREIFVECIAAQIGRSLGLSIPRPLLVQIFPAHLPELELKESAIIFGSQDVKYPSFQQFTSTTKAKEELKKWPDLLKAGCFDEWLANSDRHSGNILYSGNGSFSLIDHSHAIPRNHPNVGCNKRNTFLELIAESASDDLSNYRALKKASSHLNMFLGVMSQDWETLTHGNDYLEPAAIQKVLDFLNKRLPILSELVALHLKNKQGLLYAASR